MILLLPTPLDTPLFSVRYPLEGKEYSFRFDYVERWSSFVFDVVDDAGEPIVAGIRLVSNRPLLEAFRHDPRLPPGRLIATAQGTDVSPAKLNELGIGRRVELTYITSDEDL